MKPICAGTFVTLRLFGDALVPEHIPKLLRANPSYAAPKGLTVVAPSGRKRTTSTGRWDLTTEGIVQSPETETHIAWILDLVEKSGVPAAHLPGVTAADVLCFWLSEYGHGGPSFSPGLLARLANQGLVLSLDFYSSASPQESEQQSAFSL
jgi:hypothetical protein